MSPSSTAMQENAGRLSDSGDMAKGVERYRSTRRSPFLVLYESLSLSRTITSSMSAGLFRVSISLSMLLLGCRMPRSAISAATDDPLRSFFMSSDAVRVYMGGVTMRYSTPMHANMTILVANQYHLRRKR